MRDDGVHDRLLLPRVKIEHAARCDHVVTEPPLEEFRGGWCDEIENFGDAGFEAQAQLLCFCRQCASQSELVINFSHT